MEITNIPAEHVGVTWLVIISPLLIALAYAAVDHAVRRPPEILVLAYNALLRTKKNLLYIQSLKLENSRLKARLAALEGDRHTDQVTDLEYEEMADGRSDKAWYVRERDQTPEEWADYE